MHRNLKKIVTNNRKLFLMTMFLFLDKINYFNLLTEEVLKVHRFFQYCYRSFLLE
jgi:hypothetical protein